MCALIPQTPSPCTPTPRPHAICVPSPLPPPCAPAPPPLPPGDWKVIDLGLARRYLDGAGAVLAERTDTAFRGSSTYASVHAHRELDLGRRDDLWSWLYVVVELLDGGSRGLELLGGGSREFWSCWVVGHGV